MHREQFPRGQEKATSAASRGKRPLLVGPGMPGTLGHGKKATPHSPYGFLGEKDVLSSGIISISSFH